ncbi:MAG: DUF523 domain-containing protein [Nitrospirae bacterium]|nr:DUF523 domain-containing protein [Nitrospirota bacterium]
MVLVSACLSGLNPRFDGTNSNKKDIKALVACGNALPLCPEQLGGLTTLRLPIELEGADGRHKGAR